MIAEFGHFALALALALALLQAVLPLAGGFVGRAGWVAAARPAALGQALCLTLAFLALIHAFWVSDFSVALVAANSHTLKPAIYKLTGVWGNHEGSMLLWVLVLAWAGALVALAGRGLPEGFAGRVLGVQGVLGVAFCGFTLFASNPFLRLLPAPLEGNDLNPLLQHPGLALHPPLLYGGYVGLSLTFSFAVAALLEGRIDGVWARWLRPWALGAWALLTAGIALGSWWAYSELGWGGFWFWDPVENASFIPWLMATALLHSAVVVEKRDALKSWTVLLAIMSFAMVMVGTFIVRSGIVTSVHAFAVDPARGVVLLAIMLVLVGTALALYAWRAPLLGTGGLFRPISREGMLLFNNLLLSVSAATITLGTLWPMLVDLLGGEPVSVGAPFFNAVFVPLMVPLMIALALAPLLPWKRADLRGLGPRLALMAAVPLSLLALVAWARGLAPLGGLLGVGLGGWLAAGIASDLWTRSGGSGTPLRSRILRLAGLPRTVWGMTLAHAGVAVAILGITGTSLWTSEATGRLRPGESLSLAGWTVRLDRVDLVEGPNFDALRADLSLAGPDGQALTLHPERRVFLVGGQETTEAAIAPGGWRDLYAVVAEGNPAEGWPVTLRLKPLVGWIWAGAALMVLGGGLSLADRRLRLGVSGRRTAARRSPAASSASPLHPAEA